MNKSKVVCVLVSLVFSLAMGGGLINQSAVAAQGNEAEIEEELILVSRLPILSARADTVFEFFVDLMYVGAEEALTFELSADKPEGWIVRILEPREEKEIGAIGLAPDYPEGIIVRASAPFWELPEPGDYTITLKAETEEIKGSIDLTARVTGSWSFSVRTADGRVNIKATAGQETRLPIIITNTGTATLDEITFRSDTPRAIAGEFWSVTFSPEKIENLRPWDTREVEVTIKPPSKVIPGDYMTTLRFSSDPSTSVAPPTLAIRVTALTATKWGWIGAGIVVAVVVGLVVGVRRLGRR